MNAIDTNVFVYALDDDEPVKKAKAAALLNRLVMTPAETRLIYQVAAEFLSCLRRWQFAGKVSSTDVIAHLRNVMSMFPTALPASSVLSRSLDLSNRFSLSHWDSMLVAACLEESIETLFSEDLDPGTDYDGMRVVNPFI